jgi:hypothetical protein
MSNAGSIKVQYEAFKDAFMDKTKSRVQAIQKEILLQIGTRLVDYSAFGQPQFWHSTKGKWPKGYTPGHFILNWQLGIDSVQTQEISGANISRIQAEGIAKERFTHLGRWQVGHVYTFANTAPYAQLLETGLHSWQVMSPGIITRVILEYPQILKDAIAKVG